MHKNLMGRKMGRGDKEHRARLFSVATIERSRGNSTSLKQENNSTAVREVKPRKRLPERLRSLHVLRCQICWLWR